MAYLLWMEFQESALPKNQYKFNNFMSNVIQNWVLGALSHFSESVIGEE